MGTSNVDEEAAFDQAEDIEPATSTGAMSPDRPQVAVELPRPSSLPLCRGSHRPKRGADASVKPRR